MKKAMNSCYKKSIDQLRNELHNLIESENFTSKIVQRRSQELDHLILLYYHQEKEDQELNEP